MTDFVHRIQKHLLFSELDSRIERNPSLELRPVRELRSRAQGGTPVEQRRRSIEQLNRTFFRVYLVPFEIEDSGPEVQCPFELLRENGVRSRDSDGQIHTFRIQQVCVAIARGIFSCPVRRRRLREPGQREETDEKNKGLHSFCSNCIKTDKLKDWSRKKERCAFHCIVRKEAG